MSSDRSRLMRHVKNRPFFTAAEVRRMGINSKLLSRLARAGSIDRIARGRYRLPGARFGEHRGLLLAAAAAPKSVVCLLSALFFHDAGTQVSPEVWIAVERRKRTPKIDYPPVRVVHFSGAAFTEGIELHRIEGRTVRVYSLSKTIADCFKYRNKIGLDVALEALTDAWRRRRVRLSELEHYARVCRVLNIMRPYLQTLAA